MSALLSRITGGVPQRRFCGLFAKLLGALIALGILSIVPGVAAEPPPIFVGGQFIRQHAIQDRRGHLFVPVRGVFEALGATVTYTPPRIVVVRKNEAIVAGLVIGRRSAIVSNRRRALAVAPIRIGGHVYVPLRSVAEMAGATVIYSSKPRLVDIRVANPNLTPNLPPRPLPEIPPDPTLPPWAYVVVGVLVAGFLIELTRRLVQRAPRRRDASISRLSVGALPARGPLQLPNPISPRDQNGIGKIAK